MPREEYENGIRLGDRSRKPVADDGLDRRGGRLGAGKQFDILGAHPALLNSFREQRGVAIGELKLLAAGELLVLRYANDDGPGPGGLRRLLRVGE